MNHVLCIPRAIKRLSLSQIPVEAIMNAGQEIASRINLTCSGDRPRSHTAHKCITSCQPFPVLAIKRCPCMASAIERYLYSQRHMLR